MSLSGLRSAVVASIASEISAFNVVSAHGGRFDMKELLRWAVKSPACLVAVMGGPMDREGGGQGVCDAAVIAYIITRGTSSTKRDKDALDLSEAVGSLYATNAWGYLEAQAPMKGAITNLYHGEIDAKGVALWSVSWSQMADLDVFTAADLAALDDFNSAYVDWDLAPKNGAIDMQDVISLNGEFMSAYGHIYISADAPTSVLVAGTYYKAAGTTTLKNALDCDMPLDNRLRHTGTVVKPFQFVAGASVTVDSDAKVTLVLAPGGVPDEDTAVEQEITAAGGAETIPLGGLFNLDEDEYVEVWVTADDAVGVTLETLNMIAAAT